MKNKHLLTLAVGLLGASSLMASDVHVYLTGSTAFRANAYNAAKNLFSNTPTIYFGDANHGGAGSGWSSSTAAWVMVGTPITNMTALAGNTLHVHGLFTGSIQGIESVELQQPLVYPDDANGGVNGQLVAVNGYVTNVPTIAFDDCSSTVTTYPATGNYAEEPVGVLPFAFYKSIASGAGATTMANIAGVSWEQVEYGIPKGRIPLSAWTYNSADTNTFIYMLQRTQDSGTRRAELACMYYQDNDPVGCYLFDTVNGAWYSPSVLNSTTNATTYATAPYGVVNGGAVNSANYNWGYGYVGGGDIAKALNIGANVGGVSTVSNTAIAMLSISDGKGISSAMNWTNLLPFNGIYPTVAGAAISGQPSSYTNDFSPITQGYYPLWSQEIIVFPKKPSLQAGQTIQDSQLGSQGVAGTFLGVFNAQTTITGGSPTNNVGSIENEIYKTENGVNGPNTAIRLVSMKSNRQSTGGTISPF